MLKSSIISAFLFCIFAPGFGVCLASASSAPIAETDCGSKIADLDRLFSDRDDDFPSQVNRKALIDFLTVENKILFSNAFYEAVELTFAQKTLLVSNFFENFDLVKPEEKISLASEIWQNFVGLVAIAAQLDQPISAEDLNSRLLDRAKDEREDYAAKIKMHEVVAAVNQDREIKAETIKLISETLKEVLVLGQKSRVDRKLVAHWRDNNRGLTLQAKGVGVMNVALSVFGVPVGVLMGIDQHSALLSAAVGTAAVIGGPFLYASGMLPRMAYYKAQLAIRKRLAVRKLKKPAPVAIGVPLNGG